MQDYSFCSQRTKNNMNYMKMYFIAKDWQSLSLAKFTSGEVIVKIPGRDTRSLDFENSYKKTFF